MPKIEAGANVGIFLIDGIPYPTTQYVPFYNTKDLTKLAAEVKVDIKQTQGDQLSIASGTLDTWTDNLDTGFTDLQAFVTYIQGFFFEKSGGGGGGGLTASANGLSDDGTTVELGGTITKATTVTGVSQDLCFQITKAGIPPVASTAKINILEGTVASYASLNATNAGGFYTLTTSSTHVGQVDALTNLTELHIPIAGTIIAKDEIALKGLVGASDYTTAALADPNAYLQTRGVQELIKTTDTITFSWDDIAEGSSVGFLSILSVDGFTAANAAGKAIPSTATINAITVNLQGSSSAAAAGNVDITIQRREAGNAAVYTVGSGTTITTGSYTIGGVLGALNDRAERTTGIAASVGGTNPVLYAYVSAIGFATLSSLIVDVEYSY